MTADIGDEIVVANHPPGQKGRVGTIVGMSIAQGSPLLVVHWLAGDYDAVVLPGLARDIDVLHKAHPDRHANLFSQSEDSETAKQAHGTDWRWMITRANVGDELTVKGRRQGDGHRHGEIVEIHGPDGSPPYLVRWRDGRKSLFWPSSDCIVDHRQGVG